MPKPSIMNIDALLKAAEYIERKDREVEHGYASTRPLPVHYQSRRKMSSKQVKTRSNIRFSHNELEKNRRAHLRTCLDRLKAVVPLGRDMSRHTTLGLLKSAKLFIKRLEEVELQQRALKSQLLQDQRRLQQNVGQLSSDHYRLHSVSESSNVSSVLSTNESSSIADSEDVDVLGFSSCGFSSDLDDQHSFDSVSSDSGIGIDVVQKVMH